MTDEPPFWDEATAPEELEPARAPPPEPDGFERLVAGARRVSGYDPGAEEEADDDLAASRTQRWAGRTILVATLVLLFLNVASIRTWASTLSPTWASGTISMLAEVWSARTAELGLDAPRRAIRDTYDGLKGRPPATPTP
jgi:hypothetical protein